MKQVYGPYRLSAGQHEEDVPSDVSLKVKEVGNGFLISEDGTKYVVSRGVFVMHGDQPHSIWRDERRVSPMELAPGDHIELAHPAVYGPPTTPQNLRQTHVVYTSFMSTKELDVLYNRPDSMKFIRATDVAQADEISELRRQVAELRDRLQEKAEDRGAKQQANAEKKLDPANRNHPSKADSKTLQPA